MKINQQMSEFQLAQAQKEIVEDVLGVKHVVNTSRNAINNFNKKLGKELHVKTTDNPTLTNLIKDTAKMKKANVHYEPNTSLWYKIDGDTLYIRGHEAEGYSERVLYTDVTLSNNGWAGCTCTEAIIEEQIVPISCVNMFKNCKQLTTIQGLQNIVMNYCTNCSRMFYACNALQSIDCSNWDTYNVEDMQRMFYTCHALKDIIGLNNLDVSNVKNMKYMFCGLEQFTDLDISKWNAPKCEDAQYMFSSYMNPGYERYNGFVRINAPNLFRSGCVKNLKQMFGVNCELKYVNISNWNVSNVITMEKMFANCCNLKSVGDLSKWNAPKCTNARFMFGGDSQVDKMRFTSLTLNNLFKNGIVKDISCMFQKCYDLKSVGNLDDWNTSNVTDMDRAFFQCLQLKSIGNLSKWDTSNVIDMCAMFEGCCSLDNIGNLNDWNTSNVTDMSYMFNYSYNRYDDNGNAMNKETYKKVLGINNIPTMISIPSIPKDCDISHMFDRQKFIEDIVYCGKISQSFTTKYGNAIQDNMSSLTRESIVKIINALDPENPGTLTLCEPNYEKLTDEDKAIATSKGWTIAA